MAFQNIDQIIKGMLPPREFVKALTGTLVAGRPHSLHYLAGMPGAGVAPAAGIGGELLTSLSGGIPFTNPIAGETRLGRFQAMAGQAGTLMLCDRLWQNSGINITLNTEQAFTASADIPPRDANGLALGDQVQAAVEVSAVTGAGTPTLTLKYYNELGVQDKLGVNQIATVATSIAGSFYPIGLAAGDKGIRRAQSLTLSATWTSGTIHVILYRVIARLELQALIPNALDALSGGFPRLYDNSCPFLVFVPNTTTSNNIQGNVIFAQG